MSFFITKIDKKGRISLSEKTKITFIHTGFSKILSFCISGIRIAIASFFSEKRLQGSEKKIIEQIHQIRFNPKNSYVITGGHFSDLYMRNMGIFYNALFDGRIVLSQSDWENRQRIGLQTIATDIALLKQSKKTYTTFMPIGYGKFAGVNIYTEPSDSLFAVFYGLCAMKDRSFLSDIFPTHTITFRYPLQTQQAAKDLIKENKSLLQDLLEAYLINCLDEASGLVKKDIFLASARDGIKRQSSFYDNVIAWSTYRLAAQLSIVSISEKKLSVWKQKIMQAFWNESEGIFLDDLSSLLSSEDYFSSDMLIAVSTKFLDVKTISDRNKLERIVTYIKKNDLDKPFPLHYAKHTVVKKLYWPVKYFAPSYMGESIWSHWGMEYVKLLILLSAHTPKYFADAKKHVETYTKNIQRYGGYPELYHKSGKLFRTMFYKSVLQTSWVINYEQARMLLKDAIRQKKFL